MTNRKQIAAANWKMNLDLAQANSLLQEIASANLPMQANRIAIFAVPFPYLSIAKNILSSCTNYFIAAQDCSAHKEGAFTGEVSTAMLQSLGVDYVLVGHSERRAYHGENAKLLSEKINRAFEQNIQPIFCCGEPLEIREAGNEKSWVEQQIKEALFHLPEEKMKGFVIAYEPIWAIGTGKTASSDQAQEMHAHIRSVIAQQYGDSTANRISILYGGSVKAANAAEIFEKPDVDGGLVGGASLNAVEFGNIMQGLK